MDEAEFTLEISAAKRSGDISRLRAIVAALDGRTDPWVTLAKIKAVAARRGIEAAAAGKSATGNTTPPLGKPHWLGRYGLTQPDGRALHRYVLDDASFDLVEADLRSKVLRINADLAGDHDAALFVLWAAEWFRRNYAGGPQRWSDVGAPVGIRLEQQASWRKLADRGLRYWRLPEFRLNGLHHRLAAIARQGGFPVAALAGAQGGWAAGFLQKLVARLLETPVPTSAVAEDLARELEGAIPDLWRHDEILAVSAELALAVVELRREAEANGVTEGALISAWLDKTHPDWRHNLPLAVNQDGARQLVDGLMKVERLKAGKGAIRCRRFIVVHETGWREQTELELDGDLQSADPTQRFDTLGRDWSRLRMFACDEAAQFISGELAVVEPAEDGRWNCMASRASLRFDMPAHVSLKVELRGEGVRVAGPFVLPGGDPAGRDLRVCVDADLSLGSSPSQLEVIGLGSGGYRAEPLHLVTPECWDVLPHETDSACRDLGSDPAGKQRLWEICGAAVARSDNGDVFLVRAGQKGDQRDQILLSGTHLLGCVSADGRPAYCGAPMVRLRQGPQMRAARSGEVWWRRKGEREWKLETTGQPAGVCEFAWRDAATLHIRCKVEAVVLPDNFSCRRTVSGPWLTVEVDGWPHGVSVAPGIVSGPNQWRVEREHTTLSHFEIKLTVPGLAEPIILQTPIRHHAWLYEWSGKRLPCNGRLSLSTLSQFVARTPGRMELWAELLDAHRRPVPQANARWWIDDELPMSVIADDLAALLRSSGQLDAQVRLDFNDGRANHWRVLEFAHELGSEPRGLVPQPALFDPLARIVGRSFSAASEEKDFGPFGEEEQINHRPIALDPGPGPWLVYLRSNDRVLCRPRVVNGCDPMTAPRTALGRVMVSGPSERAADLARLIDCTLEDPGHEESLRVVRSVIDLAVSLNGLPPSTFDVFRQLELHPLLGPLMLYGARKAEIEPILRLANNLRMAWCLIPQGCWTQAWDVWGRHFFEVFPDLPADVATLMTAKRQTLVEHEPSLAPLVGLRGPNDPIAVIANSFLNRSADRIRTDVFNPFRARFADRLPTWSFDPKFWRATDAPIVAAIVARGEFLDQLSDQELTAIKDIARSHPRYFSAAFAAQFGAR